MTIAASLNDLLKIRFDNRELIERVNGNLGSAVGFKFTGDALTDEPAVIIYVPQKLHPSWLPADQVIPEFMQSADGLVCRTDVIQASRSWQDMVTLLAVHPQDPNRTLPVGFADLKEPPPLTSRNLEALQALHGATERMFAGARVFGRDQDGNGYSGTAGCFVRDRATQRLGFLTNAHVADREGNKLYYPNFNGLVAGVAQRLATEVPDERLFPRLNRRAAFYNIDCAYVELADDIASRVDPRLYGVGTIGQPLKLDLDTMGPVGRRVISVGSRRGVQSGRIAAFSFEFEDGQDSYYTDYLMIGEDGVSQDGISLLPTALSDHGDSGKLIVTDDHEHNPVALLWGGWSEQRRPGRPLEKWSWGIDINRILDTLEIDICS